MKHQYLDWPWEPMNTIPVDHELNTLLRLNPEFPLAVSHDNLSSYQNHFVNWHKQGSIEISVVKEGSPVFGEVILRNSIISRKS